MTVEVTAEHLEWLAADTTARAAIVRKSWCSTFELVASVSESSRAMP